MIFARFQVTNTGLHCQLQVQIYVLKRDPRFADKKLHVEYMFGS